ncbi:MAG: TonB-dependent receptor [Bacteroidota bacterium]
MRTYRSGVNGFFILLLMLLNSAVTSGQSCFITGKVTASNGQPLSGVTISSGTSYGVNSGADGTYRLELPSGKHIISFRLISFTTVTRELNLQAGETKTVDILLAEESQLLDVVVVSASKFEQRIEEVTVSMEVLRPYIIENTNATSVDQSLDQVPGVSIVDGQANIRGGSGWSYGAGSRVQVMVDDLPLLAADAGDAKWSFIPTENIEQAEIIKGASSVLYGSSALNGTINFRTAYAKDKPITKVGFFQGVYDHASQTLNDTTYNLDYTQGIMPKTGGMNVFHAQRFGNLDMVAGAHMFIDEGYRDGENEKRVRFNTGLRYSVPSVSGLAVGVNGNVMRSEGTNYFLWANCKEGAYLPGPNTTSDYQTLRATVDPFVRYVNPKGNSLVFRNRYFLTDNENNTNQSSRSAMTYSELQYQRSVIKDMTMTAGGVYVVNDVTSDLYGNHRGTQMAAYCQANYTHGRWNATAGARAERYTVDERKESWAPVMRLGVNYRLTEGTFLRSSFGQGYRFPTVAELFVRTNVGSLNVYPNDSLTAERGWSAEFGIMQGFKIGNWKGLVDLAVFQNDYTDMTEFTFAQWGTFADPLFGFGFKSINIGNTRIRGAEISIGGSGDVGDQSTLRLMGGYTYLDPRLISIDSSYISKIGESNVLGSDSSDFLKYRVQHTAKLDIQYDRPKWYLGTSIRYTSFMVNIDKIFVSSLFENAFPGFGVGYYRDNHHHGDAVVDTRFAWKFTDELKVSFIVKNLLNNVFMQRPADMQPPRQFVVQANIEF